MFTPSYIFVLDFRNEMGIGHLRRCVSTAEALLVEQPGSLIRLIAVGASNSLPFSIDPSLNLCFLPTEEVFKDPSCLLTQGFGSNIVFIIDHYELNSDKWLDRLRLSYPTAPVFSFDDSVLGGTWPVLGVLRLGIEAKKDDLEDKVQDFSAIGSEFLPIRNDLQNLVDNNALRFDDETGQRMMVILGGSDPEKYTERVVEALAKTATPINFDVVFGSGADPMRATVAAPDKRFTFHYSPENFIDLMYSASLAVCGGGNTCYEFLYLGVPVAVLALAENQYPTCEAVHAQGCGHFLGYMEKLSDQDLFARLETFISKTKTHKAMAEKGKRLIDGKGAERLAINIIKSITSYFLNSVRH
jgi:spore coat polysaccharide biosynthesis predicted glycosyltransferase SpsG